MRPWKQMVLLFLVMAVVVAVITPLPRPTSPIKKMPVKKAEQVEQVARSERMRVKWVDGQYCPKPGDKNYTVRTTWRNDGDRPVRTVYATIEVYDLSGQLSPHSVVDYPIYSVRDSEPGVAPGQTYTPKDDEGFVLPIQIGSPESPRDVFTTIMGGTEKGIK